MMESSGELFKRALDELDRDGFTLMPGPVPRERLPALLTAYDAAMRSGDGPDFSHGSTTTRLSDFVNQGPAFDEIYVYPPLLRVCEHVLGGRFKLSSLLGRTLRPHSVAQALHVDLERGSGDLPMVGLILMLDDFTQGNGATRFVPGSHTWAKVPGQEMADCRSSYPGEVVACGCAGSLIVFQGSTWHGHTANSTSTPRRSIQGYFVRREARSAADWSARIQPSTLARLGPLARQLLALDC